MTETSAPAGSPDTGAYEVRVQGHLDRRWALSFDGLALSHHAARTTGAAVTRCSPERAADGVEHLGRAAHPIPGRTQPAANSAEEVCRR